MLNRGKKGLAETISHLSQRGITYTGAVESCADSTLKQVRRKLLSVLWRSTKEGATEQ